MNPDEPVTRREVDQLLEAHDAAVETRNSHADERWETHRRIHEAETDALRLALDHEAEREATHRSAHDAAHVSHSAKHDSEQHAIGTALDSVNRERAIHATAHEHEHEGHQREHASGQLAIDKAEQANDKRFSSVNGTRDQMSELIRSLASKDAVDALASDFTRRWEENRKELDRRFEELRVSITNIEKGDVKGEGKDLGRSATVAVIIGAVSLVGTILGILIVVSNLATGTP